MQILKKKKQTRHCSSLPGEGIHTTWTIIQKAGIHWPPNGQVMEVKLRKVMEGPTSLNLDSFHGMLGIPHHPMVCCFFEDASLVCFGIEWKIVVHFFGGRGFLGFNMLSNFLRMKILMFSKRPWMAKCLLNKRQRCFVKRRNGRRCDWLFGHKVKTRIHKPSTSRKRKIK